MMDRKKRLVSIVAMLSISALLVSCGEKSTESVAVSEESKATASKEQVSEDVLEKEAETTDTSETEEATDEDYNFVNELAIKAPDNTGLTNIRCDNFEDGSYYYEDMTEDGVTIITNMCYRNCQRDGQDMDAYAENFVCAQVNNDAIISGSAQDDDISANLTYPVFIVNYESGGNEDTRQAVGAVVLTDTFTYYLGYECPIDYFEDNQSFYEDELKGIELIALEEFQSGADTDYAQAYLNQVEEYHKDGTADGFMLIDVNDDGTPELAAVNSEAPMEELGNAHLFTYKDGAISELISVNAGYDGAHIYISESDDIILQTGSMSGTEAFTLYTMNGKELEPYHEMLALCDTENDKYTYYNGDDEVSEQEYADAFADNISVYSPFLGIDYDGINETEVTMKDGFLNIDVTATHAYFTYDEIKEMLENPASDTTN